MASNQRYPQLQARHHALVSTERFRTAEEYCLYLMHLKAYEAASEIGAGRTALDYGCNVGYGTKVLSLRCGKTVGVDISARAIKEAQRRYGGDGIEFHVIDGSHLPFADGSFDMVVSFQVIEHISDEAGYLTEIKRVLTKNGRALFTTPNAEIRIPCGKKPFNPFHVREFSAGELRELLQKYFAPVEIQGLFAVDELYRTESQRLERIRQSFYRRPAWMNGVSGYLRAHLPEGALAIVRRTLCRPRKGNEPEKSRWRSYSTTDLFYQAENLNAALDLMAICAVSHGGEDR